MRRGEADPCRRAALAAMPLLVLVPFVYAGMGRAGSVASAVGVGFFACVVTTMVPRATSARTARVVAPPVALLALLVVAQVVPMPAALRARVAPRVDELRELVPGSQAAPQVVLTSLGVGDDLDSLTVPAAEAGRWRGLPATAGSRCAVLDRSLVLAAGGKVLAWFVLLWAFGACATVRGARERLQRIAAASALVVAIPAIASRLMGPPAWLYRAEILDRAQPAGTFVNRNHFAAFCYLALPLLVLRVLQLLRAKSWTRQAMFERVAKLVLALFAAALVLAAGLLANSRAGATVLLLETVSFLLINMVSLRRRPRAALVVVAMCVAILVAALAMERGRFMRRFEDVERDEYAWAESFDARLTMFRASFDLALAFPVLGVGLGNAGLALDVMGLQPRNVFYDHVHNEYLQWMAQTGVIGILAALVALGWLMRTLRGLPWSRPRVQMLTVALGAVALHSLVDFPLRTVSVAVLVAAILGLLLGEALELREHGT